ncbi:tetratricopeptide repeat protein [Planctomycetaceae bacterium SH139]
MRRLHLTDFPQPARTAIRDRQRKRQARRMAALLLLLAASPGCSLLSKSSEANREAESRGKLQTTAEAAQGSTLDARIAFETAMLAQQRGMDVEAIEAFEKARKLDPKMPNISHPLAVLYDRAGMVDAAEREYRLALSEVDNEAAVHCDYGYFLYSTGRLELAESELRKALELAPEDKQSRVNLGLVLGSQGKYQEAEKLFTAAIGPAAAQHNLGMLKLRRGENQAARQHLAEAVRRDPSLQQSQVILTKVKSEE